MAASSTEMQLVLAKLGELTALIGELKANQGSNATAMVAQISDNVKREVVAELNKLKEKKKAATGETKDGAVNVAPKKKTHPSLDGVTEKAWALEEKGTTEFDKRVNWFTSVMSKHQEYMTNLLTEALIKEVEASESYMNNMPSKKDATSKAKAFFKSIKNYMMKKSEAQWAEVSKKLVDAYNLEKAVYDATGLPQAKTEAAGSAEACAAAAFAAAGLGVPASVTVHTPAAQLAGV